MLLLALESSLYFWTKVKLFTLTLGIKKEDFRLHKLANSHGKRHFPL